MQKNAHIIAIPADPADPDDFDITEEDLQVALQERARRGRPTGSGAETVKQQVTLRLDPEVIAKFKATGAGWQTRINEALRRARV